MLLKNDREYIKNQIDEIENKKLIEAIKNFVEYASNNQYENHLTPLKRSDILKRAKNF